MTSTQAFSIVNSRIGVNQVILVGYHFEVPCGRRWWRYLGSSNGEVTTTAVRPRFGASWSMATPQFVYAMTGVCEKNIVALTRCGSRLRWAWSQELWRSARVPTSVTVEHFFTVAWQHTTLPTASVCSNSCSVSWPSGERITVGLMTASDEVASRDG